MPEKTFGKDFGQDFGTGKDFGKNFGEDFGKDFGRNPHITHKSNIQNILEYIQRVDYSS